MLKFLLLKLNTSQNYGNALTRNCVTQRDRQHYIL